MGTFSKTQLKDRASDFLTSSSNKLKNATQTATVFVGDVAKDAGSSVAEAAERAGTVVRTRWALLQQSRQRQQHEYHNIQQSQETVQDRFRVAAASTSTMLKRSFSETKGRVAVGKNKVEEAAKRAAQRSRSLLANIERWQKGQNSRRVFGVPLEILVQRQKSLRPIPNLVIKCVDFLVLTGLNAEYLFKYEGDELVLSRLMTLFNEDLCASIPEGVSPVDVAAFLKVYLRMLPEPLLTSNLYDEIKEAQCSVQSLRDLLKQIPPAHYSTLECLTVLLLRISQKSTLNKMDAHNLAFELAPVLIWKKGRVNSHFSQMYPNNMEVESNTFNQVEPRPFTISGKAVDSSVSSVERTTLRASDISLFRKENVDDWEEARGGGNMLNGVAEISTQISLDDEPGLAEFTVIEAVQCLIEQRNGVFADPIEMIRQELEC